MPAAPTPVALTPLHWVYAAFVVIVLVTMSLRKDTLIPCILGLFVIGWMATGTALRAIQVMFNALLASGGEFWGIIVVISLVVAMSKALGEIGADYLIMRPAAKLMVNADLAYWLLGIGMLLASWFVWPTPATALIGGIMLPVAVRAGLPIMGAAMAMNLFGHGAALSSDYIIQGAPTISGKAAGFNGPSEVMAASVPLWLTMTVVTSVAAYILIKRDLAARKGEVDQETLAFQQAATGHAFAEDGRNLGGVAYLAAVLVPAAFLIDVVIMVMSRSWPNPIRGGDATALIGGTALGIATLLAVLQFGLDAFEKITDWVRDGFMFGIKVFAPVIIIGGFFFLGKQDIAQAVFNDKTFPGLLTDIGRALAAAVPFNKVAAAVIELFVGGMIGLDGSGFAPLPLTGSLANTFGTALNIKKETLAALGQLGGVWVGGGTIIPWGLIPVAAIAGVNPMDLARKNFLPVMLGFLVTLVVAIIIL